MKNDAAWCRAMARVLMRAAEDRRDDNDVYTAMRGLAFECQGVALLLDTADQQFAEAATDPAFPQREDESDEQASERRERTRRITTRTGRAGRRLFGPP